MIPRKAEPGVTVNRKRLRTHTLFNAPQMTMLAPSVLLMEEASEETLPQGKSGTPRIRMRAETCLAVGGCPSEKPRQELASPQVWGRCPTIRGPGKREGRGRDQDARKLNKGAIVPRASLAYSGTSAAGPRSAQARSESSRLMALPHINGDLERVTC